MVFVNKEMGFLIWEMMSFAWLLLVLFSPFSAGTTDPRDVLAMNSLYLSLGSPPLLGWNAIGGDPCGEQWQGVSCVFSNITEIRLNGLNLGGVLSEGIGDFESIIVMDLSYNQIGGSIPSSLPLTLQNLYLSGNQFDGSIPANLSTLTQLTELYLDENHLTEAIPDAFQDLKGLVKLDLSGNNLTGQLPLSFGNLSLLTSLHLQNNHLSGILDVLQDLPLLDLNVENNILSGPIPAKLLNIPNFRKDGNPFNTTNPPSPSMALPPLIAWAPSPLESMGPTAGPCILELPPWTKERKFWTKNWFVWVAVAGFIALFVIGVLLLLLCRCCKGRNMKNCSDMHCAKAYKGPRKKRKQSANFSSQPTYQPEKVVSKEASMKSIEGYGLESEGISSYSEDERVTDGTRKAASSTWQKNHVDGTSYSFPVRAFTVASLQQYTNSFSEENFLGEGVLGSVYRAELPDGKLLAIKKLDTRASRWKNDAEFIELVSTISKLRHPNIVELVGYCNQHGQRLLMYEYCRNGTLFDAFHVDDGIHKTLPWNARVHVALGVARALQYLHEVCEPPIVHKNIKSVNILLDDKLAAHVSECGLAPLVFPGSASDLSGGLFVSNGYAAPEIELGSYTSCSDVYSLGVIMLELLTGRTSFDRSLPFGEQFLVRWAIPQLHDIDALARMVDVSLNEAYSMKSLSRFADIISRCVQWEPGFRPPTSEVVQDLLDMI